MAAGMSEKSCWDAWRAVQRFFHTNPYNFPEIQAAINS